MKAKAIIILGMHRSGTSLLAKAVKSLGVYLGRDEHMIGPRDDNPEGFWEHSEIVDIHEKLLNSLSSSWDTTEPLPEGWWQSEAAAESRVRLKEILTRNFSDHTLWGFKDPRTCLLLPLWKSIFQELDIEPYYILCFRNPLNVAASLHKRDRFTQEKSFALWALYALSSLYHTSNAKRMIVRYDGLLEHPIETGEEISRYLDIPYSETERDIMSSLPNRTLRHGVFTTDELLAMPSVPDMVKQIYQIGLSSERNVHELNRGHVQEKVISLYENLVHSAQLLNHKRAYRMQIYWAGIDAQFTEGKSTYITVTASDQMVSYEVELRETIGSSLRVNLMKELSYIQISRMTLVQGMEEINLLKNSGMEFVNFLMLSDRDIETDGIVGISIGDEPQLILRNLPPLQGSSILRVDISHSFQIEDEVVKKLQQLYTVNLSMHNTVKASGELVEQLQTTHSEQEETLRKTANQLEHLQTTHFVQEETLRLVAEQLEKQLDTLELLCRERETREAEYSILNQRIHNQQHEMEEMQIRLREKDQIPQIDHDMLRHRDREIERYRREVELYAASLSWRVTVPLRWLGNATRQSRKSMKSFAKSMLQWYTIQRKRHRSVGLTEKLAYKKYALILSHTNYLESMGGTEKYIYEQSSYLANNNVGVIQIYPGQSYSLLDAKDGTCYGVVADGQFRGFHSILDIASWLASLRIQLTALYTHHLLNWQLSDYKTLYTSVHAHFSSPHIMFMHDFFAVCSSYHMMYEPKAAVSIKQAVESRPCISEIAASSDHVAPICLSCRHSIQLSEWRKAIQSVLVQADQIIVPSHFVKETVSAVYGDIRDKLIVKEHLIFNKQKIVSKPKPVHRKIKLAYLGYKMNNKGWQLWERLYKDESLKQIYEFHHIGSQENYADHVVMHRYSFIKNGKMAAPNILVKHDIDLVLLWSIVPESYSYTLQESIAAGVPVLTSPLSGNIAATVDLHPELGKVLSTEEQLLTFLFQIEAVQSYVSGERARYVLEYNHLPFD